MKKLSAYLTTLFHRLCTLFYLTRAGSLVLLLAVCGETVHGAVRDDMSVIRSNRTTSHDNAALISEFLEPL
jgi:hypothetical protein